MSVGDVVVVRGESCVIVRIVQTNERTIYWVQRPNGELTVWQG